MPGLGRYGALAKNDPADGGWKLEEIGLRCLICAMPQSDMRDLMRQDASELRFIFGRCQQAAVDENRASRQRKSVDAFIVNESERVGVILRRSNRSESLTKCFDVLLELLIAD